MYDMNAVSEGRRIKLASLDEFDSAGRLVEQARDGCDDSFRQLVQLNHDSVRLYLARFISCPHQADDLAQDVFLVAYLKLGEFRGDSKFSTWIIGIARLKAFHFLRNEKALRRKHKQYFEAGLIEQQIVSLQDETDEIGHARAKALKSCIEELPNKSIRLIDQFYFQEISGVDIAAINDEASGGIRMKLLRIRKVLLRCINSKLANQHDHQ